MELSEGQQWTYDSRKNESKSRVIILKLEKGSDDEDIVHVWVDNLIINNPNLPEELIETISHMPFSREAVELSLRELCGVVEIPDYQDGYETWKECYVKGEAGVYSVSIGKSVSLMDDTINNGAPHS